RSPVSGDFSYSIPVGLDYRLFFGLKGSANLLNVDYSKLNTDNSADANFQNNIDHRFSPNIGAGIYLKSEKAYVGISVPNLLETNYYSNKTNSSVVDRPHLYVIGGYVFDLT